MTGHGIRHIDNVPLTAQRLEKLSVVGRPSCASTTELDTIMIMAKAASFVCGFTPAPSIHYFVPTTSEILSPHAYKQMI